MEIIAGQTGRAICHVVWDGRCGHDRVEELRESVSSCPRGADISVDFTDVVEIDSAILALLIGVERKARPGHLLITGASEELQTVFNRTGLSGFFRVDGPKAA